MSILIKGMGMPTKQTTFTIFPNGYVAIYDAQDSFIGETKAIPVSPHGRLIDADALINDMANMIPWAVESPEEIAMVDGLSAGYEAVKDAPTVIEAEEGE